MTLDTGLLPWSPLQYSVELYSISNISSVKRTHYLYCLSIVNDLQIHEFQNKISEISAEIAQLINVGQ